MFFFLKQFSSWMLSLGEEAKPTSLLAKLGLSCSSNVKITICHGAKRQGADISLYSMWGPATATWPTYI